MTAIAPSSQRRCATMRIQRPAAACLQTTRWCVAYVGRGKLGNKAGSPSQRGNRRPRLYNRRARLQSRALYNGQISTAGQKACWGTRCPHKSLIRRK